ncbi:MAG: hypothetical protein U0599_11345 [Vicinamibacteria bacterium]
MTEREDEPASRSAWLLALAAAGAAALPFWAGAVVPTQDGGAHLWNAWLVRHLGDPALAAGPYFELNLLAPNWGGVGPLALLLCLAPPVVAEKLLFSAIAFAIVAGAALLSRRLGGDPVLAAAAGVFLAHGWLTAMGFTGFQLATGLGWLACAWAAPALDGERKTGRDRLVAARLSAAFAVLFVLHLAAALAAAGLWAVLLASRVGRAPWRRLVAPAAPLAFLAALWLAHALATRGIEPPTYRPDDRGALGRLAELPAGTYWEAYSPADRPLGAALVVLVCGLVIARASRAERPEAGRAASAGLAAAPLVLAAYLVVPFAAGGGAFLTDRLVPLLLLLPLPWATSAGLPWRRALRAAALVLAAAALAQRAAQYRVIGRVVEAVVAANHDVPPGAFLAQPPSPGLPLARVDPFLHAWGRVAVERGAVPLDDYEAALAGWFPIRYSAAGRALADAWATRGALPPGAAVLRYEPVDPAEAGR